MQHWLFLAIAILSEVLATSLLKSSEGFSRPVPTAACIGAYVVAFYFLSLTLKTLPVGVVYAIWSGIGIVLIALIGWVFFGQRLDLPAVLGIALIMAGVIAINLFSSSIGAHR